MEKKKKTNSKQKGNRGERALAKILSERGYPSRRSQQYCGYAEGDADIISDNPIPLHWESKNVERINIYKEIEQAQRDKKDGEIAIVAHKKNRKQWLAVLYLDDFISIMDMLKEKDEKKDE